MSNGLTRRRLLAAGIAALSPLRVRAAEKFPVRNIEFIIPYAAGGGFDAARPTVASAATKPDKSKDTTSNSDPATGTRTHESETRTVSLDYFSAPYAKVLMDLAEALISFQVKRCLEGRRNDLERRSVFTGEAIRGRGAPMQIADRGQCLLRSGPEFEAFRAERNENSPQSIV